MSLGTGLDIIILLCAVALFVQTFRLEQQWRTPMRVLVLGFLLMGVSGLLQPLSEPLSFGLDIVGTLIFFAVMVRLMASGAFGKKTGA